MGVGPTVEIGSWRVLHTIFVTSILGNIQYTWPWTGTKRTYTVLLFIEHEGCDGPTGVGMITGLASNSNHGTADTELVLGVGDGTRRRRHWVVVMWGDNRSGWWGTTSQWCSLYPFPVRTIAGPERMDHLTQLRVQPHSHHRDPPLLLLISQWHYERALPLVILTHMMSLIRQLFSIYNSWFVICVVTAHGLCAKPALY